VSFVSLSLSLSLSADWVITTQSIQIYNSIEFSPFLFVCIFSRWKSSGRKLRGPISW
jgi:hypothetical protein